MNAPIIKTQTRIWKHW